MLHRIFGRAGSGKTQYMIACLKEKQSAGVDCLFLVPEQQSVDAELMLETAGASALNTEVLNFERLPNYIFRQIGGIAADSLDKMGRSVLILRSVEAVRDSLSVYGEVSGKVLSQLGDTVSALKRLGVSPAEFLETANTLAGKADETFKSKLKDVALIYGEYAKRVGDTLRDDSDSAARLAEALKGKDYFRGKAVFIDGIYTYTPIQYQIIERMAESADDIYISFTADEDGSGMFNDTQSCAEKVKRLCGGKTDDVFMPENLRSADSALRFLESSLWQAGAVYGERADSISLGACADRYEESLRAASEVYALRRRGYRFDEIAVACRHPDKYLGFLDTVFAKYGIPFYFADKDSAATKPLAAFMMGLLEMAAENCPLWAVKKYLKSTFSVLNDDVDELIHYGESWGIRGKAWTEDKPWLMNPGGYTDSITPKQELQLRRINGARQALAESVAPVIEALRAKDLTVAEGVKIIYAHLKECGASQKLVSAAEKLSALGDDDGSAKTTAMWGVTVDILDTLYRLAGDMPITVGKLKELLASMLESSDIGAIPSYTDAVSIGDARLMRADGVRAMLVLGVNEGDFPSLPSKSGVFGSREAAYLEECGIELLPGVEKAVDQERFFFYICVSAPSDYLSLSYVQCDNGSPSPMLLELQKMFPHNKTVLFGEDERDYMFCPRAAADALPYLKNKGLKAALADFLFKSGYGDYTGEPLPLQDSEAYIRERATATITLSYSRIDCYNTCGFKYLLRYILKLRDDRSINFSVVDTGNYMHRVMEEYMKKRMETGTFVPADRDETIAEIDAITEAYMGKVVQGKPTKRLEKLIGRLKNVAATVCGEMCEEFCHSAFVPEGFEVAIGAGGVAPTVLVTPKGRRVGTRGFIDRLDSAVIDGKKYIRVVDYKSSEKTVSLSKAEKGENIQMLSYLFTCCDASDEGALPAGVLYRTFALPDPKKVGQTGAITDAQNVVDAMDYTGKSIKRAKRTTDDEMDEYKRLVHTHIKEVADKIMDGDMKVSPFKKDKKDCAYCPYGEVCRQEEKKKQHR